MKILFDHKILVNLKKIVITIKALCATIFNVYFHVECVWKTLLAAIRSIELKLLKTFKWFKLRPKIVV